MLIMYGSLIPFDIDFSALSASSGLGVLAIAHVRTTFADAATNILVYLPLGLALALSGWATRLPRGLSIALAASVGAILSAIAEAIQSAISIRVAAQSDVYFNVAGTMIGALIAPTLVRLASLAMAWVRDGLARRPAAALVAGLTIGLLVFHLAPFDIMTDGGSVRSGIEQARWDLVAARPTMAGHSPWLPLATNLGAAAWFAVFGYVAVIAGLEASKERQSALFRAIQHGWVLAIAIEVSQLFMRSHVFDIAPLCLRCLGVIFGAWTAILLTGMMDRVWWHGRPRFLLPTWGLAVFACGHAGIVLLGSLDGLPSVAWTIDSLMTCRLPFESLWRLPLEHAVVNVMTTTTHFLVIAVGSIIMLRRARRTAPVWFVLSAVVAVAITAEALSVFSATRIPDPTDPLLAVAAAVLACRVYPLVRGSACVRTPLSRML